MTIFYVQLRHLASAPDMKYVGPAAGFLLLAASADATTTCPCDPATDESVPAGILRLKLVAIVSILVAGSLGVCLPIAGRRLPALHPDNDAFFAVKSFAAGVVLATGLVHILPEAFRSLASPCLGDSLLRRFPFAGFVAMMSAIGTLMVDSLATGYYRRAELSKARPVDDGDEEAPSSGEELAVRASGGGHSHGPMVVAGSDSGGSSPAAAELLRSRVVSQVLELGIVVHSVIIGITLGSSTNVSTVRPLVAALSFHQLFEGIGLGGCIVQARFRLKSMVVMAIFFSLTTPIGVAIGAAVSMTYDQRSPTALAMEGLFNSASAGILIYMALVDLLAADYMNPRMQSSWKLQLRANATLLLGIGCTSLMAKWA